MCGNRCWKKDYRSLRFDWAGQPETGRGGSAIRKQGWRLRSIAGMAEGEHRIVLETSIQHWGRTSAGDPGQSGAGQSPSRQEDGSYRLPMVSGSVTAWVGSTEFYSSTRYPRIAGSDTRAANAVAKRDPGTQPCAKGFGRCQCQNRQRAQRCFWNVGTSDAGGATGKQAQCGTGSRLGAGIVAAENSSDCGSA